MNKKLQKKCSFKNILILLLLVFILYYLLKFTKVIETFDECNSKKDKNDNEDINKEKLSKIKELTNDFLDKLFLQKNPKLARQDNMCNDAKFIIGHERIEKKNKELLLYLDFLSNLPGFEIKCIEHNITKINDNLYNNISFITWKWDELNNFKNSKFIFTFKNINNKFCIFNISTTGLPNMENDNKFTLFFKDIYDKIIEFKEKIINKY